LSLPEGTRGKRAFKPRASQIFVNSEVRGGKPIAEGKNRLDAITIQARGKNTNKLLSNPDQIEKKLFWCAKQEIREVKKDRGNCLHFQGERREWGKKKGSKKKVIGKGCVLRIVD